MLVPFSQPVAPVARYCAPGGKRGGRSNHGHSKMRHIRCGHATHREGAGHVHRGAEAQGRLCRRAAHPRRLLLAAGGLCLLPLPLLLCLLWRRLQAEPQVVREQGVHQLPAGEVRAGRAGCSWVPAQRADAFACTSRRRPAPLAPWLRWPAVRGAAAASECPAVPPTAQRTGHAQQQATHRMTAVSCGEYRCCETGRIAGARMCMSCGSTSSTMLQAGRGRWRWAVRACRAQALAVGLTPKLQPGAVPAALAPAAPCRGGSNALRGQARRPVASRRLRMVEHGGSEPARAAWGVYVTKRKLEQFLCIRAASPGPQPACLRPLVAARAAGATPSIQPRRVVRLPASRRWLSNAARGHCSCGLREEERGGVGWAHAFHPGLLLACTWAAAG